MPSGKYLADGLQSGCTANLTGAKCKLTYVGVRLISDSKGVWAHVSVGCEVRIDERDCAE